MLKCEKMDELEKLIMENKEMFTNEEPLEGHFERFEDRLKFQQRRNRIRKLYRITSIAAVGLLLIASSIFVYDRYFDAAPASFRLGDISPELQKVEYFFTSQIDQTTTGIDSLSHYTDKMTMDAMHQEIARMDSLHTDLQKKMGLNPGDERIVNAMICYYQARLKVMQNFVDMLNQIKQNNNSKNVNHENTLL
jgi:hypothetical protein